MSIERSAVLAEIDPLHRLDTKLFNSKIPSPLILGSGTLIEREDQVYPFLEAGAGAVVPRTTRDKMVRRVHPSPHLYQSGPKGQEMMLNAEWTGADISYWQPHLDKLANTHQVIMSVSGRDIEGCTKICKQLDNYHFPYLEINISCAHSNSAHGFITRNGEHVLRLVNSIKESGVVTPIAIKLGHSDYIVDLANIAKEAHADAIVAVNTFGPLFDFSINDFGETSRVLGIAQGKGGMSGAPLFQIALTDVAEIRHQVGIPVIGCGGVRTAEQAVKMLMAGADAVQIYTAAAVLGKNAPSLFTKLNTQLIGFLNTIGTNTTEELKGRALHLLDEPTNLEPIIPNVDQTTCIGCNTCETICLQNAITQLILENNQGYVANIDSNKCVGCGHCLQVCPTGALT